MKHVVVVGACYLDTILSVPRFPDEDTKLRATGLAVRGGGNGPNALHVLGQLLGRRRPRVRPYLVASLPRQAAPATRRLLASLAGAGVDARHCLFRDAHAEPAGSYILRSEATGSRTVVSHNALPEMTAREFARVVAAFGPGDASWWHFEGRIPDTTLACIRLLRAALPAARVSVEIEKPGRRGLPELAAEADVVFYSRSWAESRGHTSPEACLAAEQRRPGSLGLCTWGADGAAAMSPPPEGVCFRCPVEHPPGGIAVVDTVGAGDTFIAGMLYGLACRDEEEEAEEEAWSLSQCLRFAVNLATLKVQREGFDGLGADAAAAHALS